MISPQVALLFHDNFSVLSNALVLIYIGNKAFNSILCYRRIRINVNKYISNNSETKGDKLSTPHSFLTLAKRVLGKKSIR